MGRLRRTEWLPVLVAAPAVILALATVAWMTMALFGAHPFWQSEPLTLSEAAALRDGGEVARLLEKGHDPNARYRVREGLLSDQAKMLTPIEAAVAAKRPEIVAILVHAGATPPHPPGGPTQR